MDRLIETFSRRPSLLSTHKVLRNTYFLLSLTLLFSVLIAIFSIMLRLPAPNLVLMLVGYYGLLSLIHRFANSLAGLLATFALTGFIGYTLGPLMSMLTASFMGDLIILALGGTAIVFFCCSMYVLVARKCHMSFLSGIMISGLVALLVAIFANLFLHIPALSLAISVMFILLSSGAILWETDSIVHGGETNYIRATVSLYVSLYNIFVSLINIFYGIRSN